MSSIFSVIGDSNIRNHVNKNSCHANPALKAAQMLSCGSMSILPATLEKVRSESNACILACMTNFLTNVDGPPTVSLRVGPVLQVRFNVVHTRLIMSACTYVFGCQLLTHCLPAVDWLSLFISQSCQWLSHAYRAKMGLFWWLRMSPFYNSIDRLFECLCSWHWLCPGYRSTEVIKVVTNVSFL